MFQKVYFLKHLKYCSDFLGYKDTGEINRNGKVFYGKMISNKGGLTIFEFSCDESRMLFLEKCFKWLDTPELEVLVEKFNGKIPLTTTKEQKLCWLCEFSERWDFRAKQKAAFDSKTGERARWMIDDTVLNEEQERAVMVAAHSLGLVDIVQPMKSSYDVVLVPGGARMSCLYRTRYAGELLQQQKITAEYLVGLTGMRPILDSERKATDTYAKDAVTEYDLMCRAMEQVFDIEQTQQVIENTENINSVWALVEYGGQPAITVLAAPSTEPDKRRANTADTFLFWQDKKAAGTGKRILIVTSQIYVPYQQLEAARILGMRYGHSVETIGFPREWSGNMSGLQTAANYLQEIRSVLQSMKKLL